MEKWSNYIVSLFFSISGLCCASSRGAWAHSHALWIGRCRWEKSCHGWSQSQDEHCWSEMWCLAQHWRSEHCSSQGHRRSSQWDTMWVDLMDQLWVLQTTQRPYPPWGHWTCHTPLSVTQFTHEKQCISYSSRKSKTKTSFLNTLLCHKMFSFKNVVVRVSKRIQVSVSCKTMRYFVKITWTAICKNPQAC